MTVFEAIGRFLVGITLRYGTIGLAAGAFLESFGIPTASVVIDLTAGALILSGRTTFLKALIVSDLGLTLGSVASYYVGYGGSAAWRRLRRRPQRAEEEKSKARLLLTRYGDIAILFGQLFGPARTWISMPAGAMKVDIKRFTLYTAIGGAAYCSIAIGISLVLTRLIKAQLKNILRFLHVPVIVGILLAVLLLVTIWRHLPRNNNTKAKE